MTYASLAPSSPERGGLGASAARTSSLCDFSPAFALRRTQANAAAAKKEEQVAKLQAKVEEKEAAHQAAKDSLAEEERRCHAVAMGMVADESGEDKTLADQLKDTQNDVSAAETELKQIKMRIDHAKKELKTKAPAAKKSQSEYTKMTSNLAKYEAQVAKAQEQLDAIAYDEASTPALEERAAANKQKMDAVRETVER